MNDDTSRVPLLGQPLGVGRVGEHGRGEVRAGRPACPAALRASIGAGSTSKPELAQARRPSRRRAARGPRARRAAARPAGGCGGRSRSRARAGPRSARRRRRSRWPAPRARRAARPRPAPRPRRRPCRGRTAPAASRPPAAAFSTTCAAARSPSECSECDCRSKPARSRAPRTVAAGSAGRAGWRGVCRVSCAYDERRLAAQTAVAAGLRGLARPDHTRGRRPAGSSCR